MRCTSAAFANRDEAIQARRKIIRQSRDGAQRAPRLNVRHCENCDRYHLAGDSERDRPSGQYIRILEFLAQGYRDRETGRMMNLSPDTIDWRIREMMKRFNALSRPNLVAIVISLGIINPNDFVPAESEHIA